MVVVALIIGLIVVVAALRNSQGALFNAVGADAPKFVIIAAAILAIGAIGFVPQLSSTSKALLALVLVVLFVNNYQKILSGFQNATKAAALQTAGPSKSANASPLTAQAGAGSAAAGGVNSIVQNALGSNDASNSFGSFMGTLIGSDLAH